MDGSAGLLGGLGGLGVGGVFTRRGLGPERFGRQVGRHVVDEGRGLGDEFRRSFWFSSEAKLEQDHIGCGQ